jgi:hypothetical protein
MNILPIESSVLAGAGYDPETRILVVLFTTGKAYEYYDVPVEIYESLLAAESKGKYMNDRVIGHYFDSPFRGWKEKEPDQNP